MRPALSIKSLFRSPLRTLLTLLLLAAVSFALISRVAEYAVIEREMSRAMSYYRGIATIDTGLPNTAEASTLSQLRTDHYEWAWNDSAEAVTPKALTKEQTDAFSSLSQVTFGETRYMTAGLSDKYLRLESYASYLPSYSYTARFVMEITFDEYIPSDNIYSQKSGLKCGDFALIAGAPPLPHHGAVTIPIFEEEGASFVSGGGDAACYIMHNNPYGAEFAKNLVPGKRYLIIGRYYGFKIDTAMTYFFYLGDYDTMEYCLSLWALDGEPENYLETEKFAAVRDIVDITNSDPFVYDMVYVSDMLSIGRFASNNMSIKSGRALTPEDEGTLNCVVSDAFLKMNKLSVGDKLTFTLCDKLVEQHGGIGAVACIPERYGNPVKTVELEIVGSYIDTDTSYERAANQYMCYSPATVFVPVSLLPVDVPEDHGVKPGELSLVIGNAGDMEAFSAQAGRLAENMGYKLLLDDGGWFAVRENMSVSGQASFFTAVLFVLAGAMALWLAVYLFIGRNKRQYAIMRALGASRKSSRQALMLPLGALAVIALPVGGISGLWFVSRSLVATVGKIASAVTSEYNPDYSIPAGVIAACFFFEILLLSALTVLSLWRMGKIPPLALLQGADRSKKRGPLPADSAADFPVMPVACSPASEKLPEGGKVGAARHVWRYIRRHIARTKRKAALALLLAVLLPVATGLFAMTLLSYESMAKELEIKCTVVFISSEAVLEMEASELTRDVFYLGFFDVNCNRDISKSARMVVTNDHERALREIGVTESTVKYAEGHPELTEYGPWCIIGAGIAESYGLSPGDQIELLGSYWISNMMMGNPRSTAVKMIEVNSVRYRVAGVLSSPSFSADYSIFAPSEPSIERVYKNKVSIGNSEFTLADNERAEETRELMVGLVRKSLRFSERASSTFILDTGDLENIVRIRDLLRILFPVAAAAAALIGAVIPGIIIIQSSKEAALLRILGTTKKRTLSILTTEQFFLCVTGFAAAAAGLAVYNFALFVRASGTLALCGGLYLLCCAAAVALAAATVTRRSALEMLQTKE